MRIIGGSLKGKKLFQPIDQDTRPLKDIVKESIFNILKRDEKTLGELFIFFILETILLGRALKVNPFDQPSVELIKTQTKKFLSVNPSK